jgi:hypothetical protein
MLDNGTAIDAIERAERETPFCGCGEPTAPVARDGVIWLECAAGNQPKGNRIARLLGSIVAPAHVRRYIIEDEKAA